MAFLRKKKESAAGSVPDSAPDTERLPPLWFEIYKVAPRKWRWRLKISDVTVIAESPKAFNTKKATRESIGKIRSTVDAPIIDA